MEDSRMKSVLEMCRGAFMERADYEMSRAISNILDENTDPCAKRKITITLELKPDDTRQNIALNCTAKSALAPTKPVTTFLYVADADTVVEMAPQIPGQTDLYGNEQESRPLLKLVK